MQAFKTTLAAALCLGASLTQAQVPPPPLLPDAGRLLQENITPPARPRADSALDLQAPPPAPAPALAPEAQAASAAVRTPISAVRLEGLSRLDPVALAATLPPLDGRALDLTELRALAALVQVKIRASGLPFARAYLPAQDMAGGVLRVAVVEGQYGKIEATGDDAAVVSAAQRWLAPLRPGEPIAVGPLERSLLLLGDLPGVQSRAVLRPGAAAGTGDLAVQVGRTSGVSGEVGLDNYGNVYAGRQRVRAALDINSPFGFGDQLALRSNVSNEGTWLGSVAYSAPLNADGLRGLVSAARTDYQLGQEFASLGAHGTADVTSAGLSWPLLRSEISTVRLSGTWQYKRLKDNRDALASSETKHVDLLPLVLSADRRDDSGTSWGSAGLSLGRLHLDSSGQQSADAASARTQGGFAKLNVDVVRLQGFGPQWSVYGRVAGQWADKNLDSSEKFVLGGAYGVRAWSSGEGAGDTGVLGQLELRYRAGAWEPFAFVDAGSVRLNRIPFSPVDNTRSLAGPGLGLRWNDGRWAAEATLARRTAGRVQGTSATQAWVNLGYRF